MQQQSVFKLITVLVLSVLFLLIAGCGDDKPKQQASKAATEKTVDPDVIAQVGDQEITFSELNTMLNSSAMVGLSVPALGTPERTQVILTLLDKLISANLTYLDAKKQGADRLTSYTEDVARFEDAVVAALYESAVMVGDIQVSDTEVLHYYNNETNKGEECMDVGLRPSDGVERGSQSRVRRGEGQMAPGRPDRDSQKWTEPGWSSGPRHRRRFHRSQSGIPVCPEVGRGYRCCR